MKFVHEIPAIVMKKKLIIADIHIGVEYRFRRNGIQLPSQTDSMLEMIIDAINEY
ncbi:MAG: hypothetical protein GXO64_00885, partial [Candidatus Micrarchaeota archaeon]|nr:hypothetical protein [Candidatus Micrarchaeota archaeon]